MKRIFDVCVALVMLVPALILILVCASLVKLTSRGPAFYTQTRIGRNGVPFRLYKIRTMEHGSGRQRDFVKPGDLRVTSVGRVLRAHHLDELPQLLNVLKGDMSLVGPRPRPVDRAGELLHSSRFRESLSVRPGLTGLMQIRGRLWIMERGFQRALRLDAYYAKRACLCLDLRILAKTVRVVVEGKGV